MTSGAAGLAAAKVIIPAMADAGAHLMAAAFRAVGLQADVTPASDAQTLELGARYTSGDECFPAKVTIGDFMKVLQHSGTDPTRIVLFMPLADGPCRFGQYAPYLRSLLDANGFGQVRILSPNCDDGYATLGELAQPFFRTAWRAAVAGDILQKLLLMVRPYELEPGATERAYRDSLVTLRRAVEASPLEPRAQLRALCDALAECRDRFQGIQTQPDRDRPLIGIVGEIFCRLNSFANQDLVRRLEECGAEAWIAGFSEWVWYTNAEELRLLKLHHHLLSGRAVAAWMRRHAQQHDEEAMLEPFRQDFAGREEAPIAEVLEAARPYLPPEGAIGEMVLNVGNACCLARRGVDGILDISPFTCMNGIVSEAIYPRIGRDLDGLPIRILYFDGVLTELDSDLQVFLEMASDYRRRRTRFPCARAPAKSPAPRPQIRQRQSRP